jgi:alcohol dehydrogenase class IV
MHLPRKLVFGADCAGQVPSDLASAGCKRVFCVSSPETRALSAPLRETGIEWADWAEVKQEPTVEMLRAALSAARDFRADAIVGVGGGSAMDVAKLVAALIDGKRDIRDAFGIGKIAGRSVHLVCLPTTAGTGSEVSPNAILLDENENLKKGVISPHLMPDASYVDPMLTIGVPAAVTAATGMDALTHCIEAYANKFSHPMIDLYALEGVRLIAANIPAAVEDGKNLKARTALALASMYGGMCLGPVNTGAVHALAYPLGSEFHVAHGVSNAVLLPHVLEFNLPAAPERYASIAVALGAERGRDDRETAQRGLDLMRNLSHKVGIPARLSDLGVPETAVERMARAAMTVTRLLNLNVREVTLDDAIAIYRRAFL